MSEKELIEKQNLFFDSLSKEELKELPEVLSYLNSNKVNPNKFITHLVFQICKNKKMGDQNLLLPLFEELVRRLKEQLIKYMKKRNIIDNVDDCMDENGNMIKTPGEPLGGYQR